MTVSVTIDSLAEHLYQDIITNLVRQISLNTLSRHNSIQRSTEGSETFFHPSSNSSTKDIYGQDKMKLKSSEASRYFECRNCGRKIAGGRFASHINKCFEGDRRA